MTRRTRTNHAIAALVLFLFAKGYPGVAQQPISGQQQKVVDVMTAFFAAAHDDNLAKFHSVVAPGAYLYDSGVRFDGDSIMALIKTLHDAGKRYEWHVTEPDVHIDGKNAWIAYVNKGTITSGSVTTDKKWLESAILRKQSGSWKIVFLHSTPVASAPPAGPK